MHFGEYLWAGSSITKGLYHLNWNANDSSGNSNNWTSTNVTWVNGKFWQCASFTGNGYITTSWGHGYTMGGDYTMSARIKLNALPSNWQYQFAVSIRESTNISSFDIMIAKESNINKIYYGRWMTNVDSWNSVNYTVEANKWMLLTTTQDSTNCYLYLNGALIASDLKKTWNWAFYLGNELWIWDWPGLHTWFDWMVDEVICEPRRWTAEEIKKYYTYTQWKFWILNQE